MGGDGETRRPSDQRGVDLSDVALVLVLRVAPLRGYLGTLCWVSEVGQAGVVELQIGAPELGDSAHLLCVGRRQIGPELVLVGVDGRVESRTAAPVVDHARRGNREFRRAAAGHRLQEREVVAEDGRVQADLAIDDQCRRGEVQIALLVAKVDLDRVAGLTDPTKPVNEVHVPRGTSELPVRAGLQADVFLQRDDVPDRFVLDPAQRFVGDLSGPVGRTRLQEPVRTRQAADVVGPEGGRASRGHHST